MRQLIIFLLLSCQLLLAYSQKTEFSMNIGSGLFFHGGKSAVSRQNITYYIDDFPPFQRYYSNAYGTRPALSLTAGGEVKRISRQGVLFGTGLQYQSLTARSAIDTVFIRGFVQPQDQVLDNGYSQVRNEYVCFSPFVGKRFKLSKWVCDIQTGIDIALLFKSREKLQMHADGSSSTVKREIEKKSTDTRLNLSVSMAYKKMSVQLGYHHGISNIAVYTYGATPLSAYSRFISLSFAYRIK